MRRVHFGEGIVLRNVAEETALKYATKHGSEGNRTVAVNGRFFGGLWDGEDHRVVPGRRGTANRTTKAEEIAEGVEKRRGVVRGIGGGGQGDKNAGVYAVDPAGSIERVRTKCAEDVGGRENLKSETRVTGGGNKGGEKSSVWLSVNFREEDFGVLDGGDVRAGINRWSVAGAEGPFEGADGLVRGNIRGEVNLGAVGGRPDGRGIV